MLKLIKPNTAPPGYKICKRCKATLHVSFFSVDNSKKDKLNRWCRSCGYDYSKAHRPKDFHRRPDIVAYKKKRHAEHPEFKMLHHAKVRAKANWLDIDIELSDIIIPLFCPVLGIPISVGTGKPHDGSPTIDRIDNKKGYTKDNIWVISYKANTIKNNASLAELKLVVSALEKLKCSS